MRQKAGNLRRAYGISLAMYRELFAAQKGRCAICGERETKTRLGVLVHLAVDHCHMSGRVRGLLCQDCNRAIGMMRDSPKRLRLAAAYLERKS